MINPKTTSYPTLAVIERFDVPPELHGRCYEISRVLRDCAEQGYNETEMKCAARARSSQALNYNTMDQLAVGAVRAAKAGGWWAAA